MADPTVLLSAFEPFGGAHHNASAMALRGLDGRMLGGHRLRVAILPVSFARAWPVLAQAIEAARPRAVVAFGEAAGRPVISLERVALNWMDARIADNDGAQPSDAVIDTAAPPACFSRLPLRRMLNRLSRAGIPAEISLSAGSFVCNRLFFDLLRHTADLPCGFVHLPLSPRQACGQREQASLSTALARRGVRVLVETILAG